MTQRTHFRVGDRVTVHGYNVTHPEIAFRGRVICTNRKSELGLSIIVLIDLDRTEAIEKFMTDGTRDIMRLTLGWPPKDTG
jgi:hypothetical protein